MYITTLCNLKGGVGKTASTVSIAGELAADDHRVLVVDTDAQGGLTISCGYDPSELYPTLTECIEGEATPGETIVGTGFGPDLLPARLSLSFSALRAALGEPTPETRKGEEPYLAMRRILQSVGEHYDVVIIDTPPAVSLPMVSALAAADSTIIPIDCKPLALRGLKLVMQCIQLIRIRANSGLKVLGVLPTMFRKRTLLSAEITEALKNQCNEHGIPMFSPVSHSVRFSELPRTGGPMRDYVPELSKPYQEVAEEVKRHAKQTQGATQE